METITVFYPERSEQVGVDLHKPISAQLEPGWIGLVWGDVRVGVKEVTVDLGMNDDTIEIATMDNIVVVARRRWEDALDNSIWAWKLVDSADEVFVDTFRSVKRENLRDAAVLADDMLAAAREDMSALYGKCECPDDGLTTCAKCGAYARVIGWSNQR